jgi:hypothetical protein
MSPPPSDLSEVSFDDDEHHLGGVSSFPILNHPGSDDEDSDGEDPTMGRVHDRYSTSSTISLQLEERIEALQRVNDDLKRRLHDTEETLSKRLTERESEIVEMGQRLEELRLELTATKRTEKELKAKDVRNLIHPSSAMLKPLHF